VSTVPEAPSTLTLQASAASTAPSRSRPLWLGAVGVAGFIALWQLAVLGDAPVVGHVPSPTAVARALLHLSGSGGFWSSWADSATRVGVGFIAALAVGVPFGLLLAVSPRARSLLFPPFEILRPIPPLAWVPLSVLFWPTENLSIEFVIFLGAFYTIVLNVLGGADQIDRRHLLVARSLGAGNWTVFRRVILPATLPSLATGAVVGIGITWEVVVAAELISGGSQSINGGGLGFLLWNAYQGGAIPQVVVCMISLGIAGYVSSTILRRLADRLMPWKRAT
jgi:NitT/TauT family transport system permease protein